MKVKVQRKMKAIMKVKDSHEGEGTEEVLMKVK